MRHTVKVILQETKEKELTPEVRARVLEHIHETDDDPAPSADGPVLAFGF
jgi:hypothetical protein